MAKLLKHPLDVVAVCPVRGCFCEQTYDFEDIIPNEDGTRLGSARQYSCAHCLGSYHRDFEPLALVTDADIGRVIDAREDAAVRKGTMVGIPLPAALSAPGPVSRGVASSGRYSFVGDLVP